MRAVLISTYDLGRQPFGLASPAAWLRGAGWDVDLVDTTRDRLADSRVLAADLIGLYLPMHTATRLAQPLLGRIARVNPVARVCAFGVYAPPNADWLRSLGVTDIIGGEFEGALAAIAAGLSGGAAGDQTSAPNPVRDEPGSPVPRLHFLVPDRHGLPAIDRYASLRWPDGERRLVGYTEASRGCRHLCRHCPIVPVYEGRFRVVPVEVVLADIDAQVAAGARHVTFGDPDFFNGPTHALRVVEALHARHPGVSYDVTIKVEHLLAERDRLPRLAETGCAFVTSAVESLDDEVLEALAKGHTRADVERAVDVCRAAGLTISPTFVAFHPWQTLGRYNEWLDELVRLDLVEQVAPIQLAIRLLVPQGSRMLELETVREAVRGFDAASLSHQWVHRDPRVDAFQREVAEVVGQRARDARGHVFDDVRQLAREWAGLPPPSTRPARARATVPYLDEPWYC